MRPPSPHKVCKDASCTNSRRNRFIVLGSSGEVLPVTRKSLGQMSVYSSCNSQSTDSFHSAKETIDEEPGTTHACLVLETKRGDRRGGVAFYSRGERFCSGGGAQIDETLQRPIGHARETGHLRAAAQGRPEAGEHGDRRDFLQHLVRREQLRRRHQRQRQPRLRSGHQVSPSNGVCAELPLRKRP